MDHFIANIWERLGKGIIFGFLRVFELIDMVE